MAKPKPQSFLKILESLASSSGRRPHEVFRSFCLCAACCVAAGTREPEYLQEATRWERPHLERMGEALGQLFCEMEAKPYRDVLGPVHMEWGSKGDHQWNGEFYTPADVCRAMVRMTLPDELPEDRPLEVLEPCCGSGTMVLACAEALFDRGLPPSRMRVTCIDTNRLACDMCFVNLTMWGIPATVVHGNSLSLETWGAWRNLFWLTARGGARPVEEVGETTDVILPRADERGQYAFDLEVAGA